MRSNGEVIMREVTPRSPFALLLILIVFAYTGFVVFAPLYAIVDGTLENGFAPVKTALDDPQVRHAIQLSFRLSLLAMAFHGVFGMILAWVMVRQEFFGKRIL